MEKHSKIYVAGNTGLVGSAIARKLETEGYNNLVFTPFPEYDLTNQKQVNDFFAKEKPEIAKEKLGWEPKVKFEELVKIMAQADWEKVQRRGF